MKQNRLYLMSHIESSGQLHRFRIDLQGYDSGQVIEFMEEAAELLFKKPLSDFSDDLIENSHNIKKIIISRFRTGGTDKTPLPIVFPVIENSESDLPDDITRVYCDGSSSVQGNGGWAFAVEKNNSISTDSGSEKSGDSCRMELLAALMGIKKISDSSLLVCTDSQYVKRGVERRLHSWKANGFITASGRGVKNKDLWQEMAEQLKVKKIYWKWVKSGGGDSLHQRCHDLAKKEALKK